MTELIRENYRETLEYRFRGFLSEATPEEIRFMDGVLMDHESSSNHGAGNPQLEIANSFEREINRGVRWVKVPHELRDKVVDFVELLTKPAGEVA